MKYLLNLTVVCVILASAGALATLPEGRQVFRVSHTSSAGDDLYVGDDKKTVKEATNGGFSKFDIAATSVASYWGLSSVSQIEVGLIYTQLDLGSKEVGGISQLNTHYRHELVNWSGLTVEGGLGVRTPGNRRSGDRFDSYNDGQIKFDYNVDFSYAATTWLTLSLANRFTERSSAGSKSQRLHELGASFQVQEHTYVRPFYQIFSTRAGRDISDTDFSNRFSEVKEKWNAAGVTVGHDLNQSLGFDVSYFQKLSTGAENTNTNVGFTVGVNYLL